MATFCFIGFTDFWQVLFPVDFVSFRFVLWPASWTGDKFVVGISVVGGTSSKCEGQGIPSVG